MFKLIVSNLRQRPTRTFVSVIAVALGVALLLVSMGLSYGQLVDTVRRAQGIGGGLHPSAFGCLGDFCPQQRHDSSSRPKGD